MVLVLTGTSGAGGFKSRSGFSIGPLYGGVRAETRGPGAVFCYSKPLGDRLTITPQLSWVKLDQEHPGNMLNPSLLLYYKLLGAGNVHLSVGAGGEFLVFKGEDNSASKSMGFGLSSRNSYILNQRWGLSFLFQVCQPLAHLQKGISGPFWKAGFSIDYFFYRDQDKDGVPDDQDSCLETPSGARVNSHGCALDSDGDGVFDGLDQCPGTPFAALVDPRGCPLDSDNDGVFNGVDLCEGTPEGINVDSLGCPSDSDGDGIPDFKDSCTATPAGALVNKWGCPSDSDQDGVLDGLDECPNTPTGFEVDKYGCPAVKPITKEVIIDLYDNSLNLTAKAAQQLEIVAERIYAYPTSRYELKVHTDTEGSSVYNLNRSNEVANKIKQFLIAKGVKESQIDLKGVGKNYPIMKGFSEEAKVKNRRLEIERIIDYN